MVMMYRCIGVAGLQKGKGRGGGGKARVMEAGSVFARCRFGDVDWLCSVIFRIFLDTEERKRLGCISPGRKCSVIVIVAVLFCASTSRKARGRETYSETTRGLFFFFFLPPFFFSLKMLSG